MKDTNITPNSIEQNRFETISEFKNCINRHGEVEFLWEDSHYSITHYNGMISISKVYKQDTERLFNTVDDLLQFHVNGEELRKIVREITVLYRTV